MIALGAGGRLLPLLLLIISCAKKSDLPEWVIHFKPKRGEVCGVGIAGIHMKGFAYQRATAIARAVDEIARQKGVTVNTQVEYFMKGTTAGSEAYLSVYSVQTTEGQTIRAVLKEAYHDREKGTFYVLMCEEK